MDVVFTQYFFQYLPAALLFFPIVWLVARGRRNNKLSIGRIYFVGILSTALIAAAVRFIAIFILGGKLVMAPVGGYSALFFIGLPVASAICVCLLLRSKARPSINSAEV